MSCSINFALPARLGRSKHGATAVEFALIAAPLFALIVGLLEVGLIFLSQTSFERQVDQAARLVRTGQAQQLGWQLSDFKSAVCGQLIIGSDCQNNLRLDIRPLANAGGAQALASAAIGASGSIDLGATEEVVLVRAELDYEPLFSAGGLGPLSGAGGTPFSFSAAVMVRNEPF